MHLQPPCQSHSETSVAAAESIKPDAARLRMQVYSYLVDCGDDGATDEEGVAATGIAANTYRPRRVELVSDGKVIDSGVKRPTTSGRSAVVWKAGESDKPITRREINERD